MATDKGRPHLTPEARRQAEARRRRLARALRENLGKRKQQARARGPRPDPREDRS